VFFRVHFSKRDDAERQRFIVIPKPLFAGRKPSEENPEICAYNPSGLPASIGLPLHPLALASMGVDIFGAVEHSRQINRYVFLFTAAPLRVAMGTGSPLNPLAIF
jgi:hypothetical protein